jgi:hypothetical protein
MPTQSQFENRELNTQSQYTFKDSRDYKGEGFKKYLTPDFFRVDDTTITSFFNWDTLRLNNELIAFNEPTTITALEIPPNTLVSPDMPLGIYKRNSIATLYFWVNGKQIAQRYQLQSLSSQSIENLSEETGNRILNSFLTRYSEIARRLSIFGLGNKLADVTDYLIEQLNAENVWGVWIPVGQVIQNISDVLPQDEQTKSVLEDFCKENPNDNLCRQKKSSSNLLPWILTGTGLITQNLWISGIGILLRLRK